MATKQPEPSQESALYEHKQEAVQRPDVGVQEGFRDHKPPRKYRYDRTYALTAFRNCGLR